MPVLEDGDFRLTESSAILKYLADKVDSPAYPKDLQKRARVNEMMDWLNTGLLPRLRVRPRVPADLPAPQAPERRGARRARSQWGKEKAKFWLNVLDQHLLGSGKKYLCGDDITIADYLGAGMVSLGELIHCDFSQYPNLGRWYAAMKARPNWAKVNEMFYGFVGALKDKTFEAV